MAVAVGSNRKRTISRKRRFSDKPPFHSKDSFGRQFHTLCRGFLRFKLFVRASLFKTNSKPLIIINRRRETEVNLFAHKKEDSQVQVVDGDDDDDEQQHSSSTWGVSSGKNGNILRVSLLPTHLKESFLPLTDKEEAQVTSAFLLRNRLNVYVTHKNSNIVIDGQTLQCLEPNGWLNDEVVNVYLELLKERETRHPHMYFKCHFFNTFFYIKLVNQGGYNFEAVRRWTTQRRLGYYLNDCDIIFVPIHFGIHWTLAVINNRERKFLYLDSLNGLDPAALNALAKYWVDEVRNKSGKTVDVSSWEMEYVKDLPRQQNGYDCGMFMLKYIDFYSKGLSLQQFSQKDMPYFRLRTAKEILRLQAN